MLLDAIPFSLTSSLNCVSRMTKSWDSASTMTMFSFSKTFKVLYFIPSRWESNKRKFTFFSIYPDNLDISALNLEDIETIASNEEIFSAIAVSNFRDSCKIHVDPFTGFWMLHFFSIKMQQFWGTALIWYSQIRAEIVKISRASLNTVIFMQFFEI